MTTGSRLAPEPYRAALLASMRDAAPRCLAQVATVHEGAPAVRTITLHHLEERDGLDALAFSTSTRSAKWAHLGKTPRLAGVFFDAARSIQFRWEGAAELVELASPRGELVRRMWARLSPSVRAFTWRDWLGADRAFDADEPCPVEGLVVCRPDAWDLLRFDLEDYARSERTLLGRSGATWSARSAPLQRTVDP